MARDGFAAGIGRLTPGDVISDGDGNLANTRTGEPVAPPGAPAPETDAVGAADPLAGLDADDVAGWRRQLANGVRTAEELKAAYNLSDSELAAVQNPPKPPSKAHIERELAEIAQFRRTDARAYWKDEAKQARELELLGKLEQLKTEAPAVAAITNPEGLATIEQPEGLAAIETELAAIAERRKTDRRSYDKDEALQKRELELIEQRTQLQDAARGETQVKAVVEAVLGEVSDAGQFEAGFDAAFGGLSGEGQEAVRAALRAPVMEASRPASEKAMETFRGQGAEAAAVLSAWGRSAAKKLATAEARFDNICNGMSEADEKAAVAWFKGLDAGSRAAVVRALAG